MCFNLRANWQSVAAWISRNSLTPCSKQARYLKFRWSKGLMKTRTIIRNKGLFVLNYSARPKKNVLVILMSKVLLTTKNSGNHETTFSNKGLNTNNMMFVEDNEIVREEETIANITNNYFANIITHLKLKLTKTDPWANLESIIDTFQNHKGI